MVEGFPSLPTRSMPPDKRATARARLFQAVAPRPTVRARRKRWLLVGIPVLALTGTVTAAAAVITARTAPATETVLCYSKASSGSGANGASFPGTSVSISDHEGAVIIKDAVGICSQAWRDGVLVLGSSSLGEHIRPLGNRPVPELTVCVRRDDAIAVLPGPAGVCKSAGMDAFAGYR